jgi:hypothetical protein
MGALVGWLVGVATKSVSGIDSDAPQQGGDFLVEQAADLVDFSYAQAGEDGAWPVDGDNRIAGGVPVNQ